MPPHSGAAPRRAARPPRDTGRCECASTPRFSDARAHSCDQAERRARIRPPPRGSAARRPSGSRQARAIPMLWSSVDAAHDVVERHDQLERAREERSRPRAVREEQAQRRGDCTSRRAAAGPHSVPRSRRHSSATRCASAGSPRRPSICELMSRIDARSASAPASVASSTSAKRELSVSRAPCPRRIRTSVRIRLSRMAWSGSSLPSYQSSARSQSASASS